MHTHLPLFAALLACACVGALGASASAAQGVASSTATRQATLMPQSVTLTGCVEYGARDSYVLTTMNVPKQPDMSNESALEREELAAAERSYQLTPEKGEHFSQLIGAEVRVNGTVTRAPALTSTPSSRGPASTSGSTSNTAAGQRPATASGADQLNVSSVQKLSEHCEAEPTMFAR